MASDWCTKKTWSEADQADFFAHLKRSRQKAQYLWKQAYNLEEVGSPELLQVAIKLLDKLLTDFPEQFWLATAHGQKARCYLKLGDIDRAIVNYQRALATERETGKSATDVFIEFGKLVTEEKLCQHFDEALTAVEAGMNYRGTHLPSEIFYAFGIRSMIAAHRGQDEKAKEFAKIALEAAVKDNSGVRHHPKFGLVRDKKTKFYEAIETIATKHIQSFSN